MPSILELLSFKSRLSERVRWSIHFALRGLTIRMRVLPKISIAGVQKGGTTGLSSAMSGLTSTFYRTSDKAVTCIVIYAARRLIGSVMGTMNTGDGVPDRVSIDKRPAVVERRSRLGDWGLDIIMGKGHKGALVSLSERKSRLALIAKVPSKASEGITQAVVGLLKSLAERVHTLTSDKGKEFPQHTAVAKALNARFYFAHAYASWERGLNENTNGLIRQYFPKNRDFSIITDKEIRIVMEKLNNRPRKCFGMKTPNQVFFGINPAVALMS